MNGSAAAESFFADYFLECDPGNENLFVAHLDDQTRCLHVSRHAGDACNAELPIREIIVTAASLGSAGLILAHNHPSGDSRPSPSDCRATRRLAAVAEAIDCTVLDHLVFGGRSCTSFRKMGLI